MTKQEIDSIVNRLWFLRTIADVQNRTLRQIPIVDNDGVWMFALGYEKESKKPFMQAKFYSFNGNPPRNDANFTQYGKVSGDWKEYNVELDGKYIPVKGKIPSTGYEVASAPQIFSKFGTVSEPVAISAKIFKPKNDQGCECGAFVTGAKKGDPNHSDWCPAKGTNSKKSKKKDED